MKGKKNFLKERYIKIPSKSEYGSSCKGDCGDNCGDGGDDGREKLKRRRAYESRCYFKIPYLRISPNPLSIAFLLLVIFSNDLWPHTRVLVTSSPLHVRHPWHRHRQQPKLQSGRTVSVPFTSKSHLPASYPFNNSIVSFNSVNTLSYNSVAPIIVSSDKQDRHFNTLSTDLNSGEMFLKSSHQFLRKRYGRSSRSHRISSSSSPPRDLRSRKLSPSPYSYVAGPVLLPTTTSASVSPPTSSPSTKVASSSMPPCSHVGDATNEISARAYIADTVFEGKVRSKSTVKDPVGKYGVTFVVQHVYKDQSNGQSSLRPKTQVRLFFVEKSSPASNVTKPTAHCVQKYNYMKRQGDLTKANIVRGRRYIVFVNRIGPHNYTIIGEPVPQSKKNMQAVKEVLCKNCVKQIEVGGLKNETVTLGAELKLVCRIKGTPLPALQWFKDGAPIIVTSRLRIQYKKRRSLLVIPEVRSTDSGKYECRGIGVQSISPVSSSSVVSINARFDNITALWPLEGKPCPMHLVYCMNGGSCTYYETIGEFTCQCADGFNGGRCENKDVANSNSTYEPITCFDGVTSSYPCVTVHKPLDFFACGWIHLNKEYHHPPFQANQKVRVADAGGSSSRIIFE